MVLEAVQQFCYVFDGERNMFSFRSVAQATMSENDRSEFDSTSSSVFCRTLSTLSPLGTIYCLRFSDHPLGGGA